MASLELVQHHHRVLCQLHHLLLLFMVISWVMLQAAQANILLFHKDNFSDMRNVRLVEEGSWYTGAQPYVSEESAAIWLTPDPRDTLRRSYSKTNNLGRVVYANTIVPIAAMSFNTSFSFQIINDGTYANYCGSGLTFFISAFRQAPVNSLGGYLGLSNTTSNASSPGLFFFAVEFDTALTSSLGYPISAEPSSSHVGIDVNSLASINVTNTDNTSSPLFYPEFFLYNNSTFTSWVSYDAPSFRIRVWMVNASFTSLPDAPTPDALLVVQATYDLSTVLLPSARAYLGFSGTNLASLYCSEGIALYSWAFSFQDEPLPPPAPSPPNPHPPAPAPPPSSITRTPPPPPPPPPLNAARPSIPTGVAVRVVSTLSLGMLAFVL